MLRAPLAPAAVAVAFAGGVAQVNAPLAIGIALVAATASAMLATASADRARAVVWVASCVAAAAIAARLVIGAAVPNLDVARLLALDGPRAAFAHPLRALVPEPESGILLGIVLGERASVSADLSYAFAVSGTTHLLAISGFNMTLVASAVALALRSRVRPIVRAAVTIAAVATYSVLVGLAPSVLRAALMSVVAGIGLASGRRAASANALCAAITFMLLVSPDAILDVGFLLSALATGGLIAFQSPLSERLARLPVALREGLSTTLAATAPTLPLVAAVFGRVSVVSPVANLIAVPLFPALMLAGAATSAIGAISIDLARPIALVAYACAFALRVVVETSAAMPLAALSVPASPLTGIALAVLDIGAVFAVARVRRVALPAVPLARPSARHLIAASVGVAVLAGGILIWPAPDPAVRIRALDIGQGDAYLVETGGSTMLIDGGPDPARLLEELGASLPPWHRRIDVVALTHAHLDHGAGLIAVLERFEVGLAIEPVGLNAGPLADAWAAAAAKANVPRRAVRGGNRLVVGDATVTILSPIDDPAVEVPSLVMRLERGRFSALFTGDATDQALADLLLHPEVLHSRVYVPPHHGAETPYASAMVAAVRPEAALISVGAQNRYGHPTPDTLAALRAVATYRTDRDGTVEITSDGTGIASRTHANGLPPPRRGSVPYAPARR